MFRVTQEREREKKRGREPGRTCYNFMHAVLSGLQAQSQYETLSHDLYNIAAVSYVADFMVHVVHIYIF